MRIAGVLALSCAAAVASPLRAQETSPSDPVPATVAPAATAPAATAPTKEEPAKGEPAAAVPLTVDVAPNPALPAKTDITIDRRNQLAAGLSFGGPLGATFRLDLLHGLGADVREEKERVKAVCALPIPHCGGGFLLGAEAGSGGGKLSLGVGANARVDSEDFKGTVGVELKVSLARTWGSPIGTEPGLTYLGPELDLYVLRFGLGLGVLWRMAGDAGSSVLFTWGLGIRL